MKRELTRTLRTLAPNNQHISESEYEIVVVDNGSKCKYDLELLHSICGNLRFLSMSNANWSPVDAMNHGISAARGAVICACIDGARMASPNLLKMGTAACDAYPRAVVGSLSFHLGPMAQNESVHRGYNQVAEDALLQTVDWVHNGYELFNISSFDPSSRFGLYECPAETNSLFMRRELWEECGGFDPAFRGKGGGLVNLDLWRRLCEDDRNVIVILLGEGTFHQFHDGVATNAEADAWQILHREYVQIRGVPYRVPMRTPFLFGKMNPWIKEFENRLKGQVIAASPEP